MKNISTLKKITIWSLLSKISKIGFDLLRKSMNRSPLPRSPLMHHNSLKDSPVCKWASFIRLLLQVIQWFGYDITQIIQNIHENKQAKIQHCISRGFKRGIGTLVKTVIKLCSMQRARASKSNIIDSYNYSI